MGDTCLALRVLLLLLLLPLWNLSFGFKDQPKGCEWTSRSDLVYVPLTAAVSLEPQALQLAAQLPRHLGSTQHAMLVHTIAAGPAPKNSSRVNDSMTRSQWSCTASSS